MIGNDQEYLEKISELSKSYRDLQKKYGSIAKELLAIQTEASELLSAAKRNWEISNNSIEEKMNTILDSIKVISSDCSALTQKKAPIQSCDYSLTFIENEGKVVFHNGARYVDIKFSANSLKIITLLLKEFNDSKNLPPQKRGYISLIDLKKSIFGEKHHGKDITSALNNIKKRLRNNGLTQENIIEQKDKQVRFNIGNGSVMILNENRVD